MNRIASILIAAIVLTLSTATSANDAKRSITKIAGDLYRFQNNFHVSVFLVTSEGIIATDPINAEAAAWLRKELKSRFNQPIKYLIYSHDHRDHIAGGEVLGEGAVVIAHESAKRAIIGEKRPTRVPDVTFRDRMTVELGGKQVHLIYPGRSHSDNLIVMHFPAERAVFTVDFISVNRVAFKQLDDAYFPQWIDAIRRVEGIDFDILVPGHGPLGTKADARTHRLYLQALYDRVLAAARSGLNLEQTVKSVDLSDFSSLGQFDAWSGLNVKGMYRQVQLHRRGN